MGEHAGQDAVYPVGLLSQEARLFDLLEPLVVGPVEKLGVGMQVIYVAS